MNLATGLCEDNEESRNLSVSTKSGRFLNLFSVVRWEILIGKEQFASTIPIGLFGWQFSFGYIWYMQYLDHLEKIRWMIFTSKVHIITYPHLKIFIFTG